MKRYIRICTELNCEFVLCETLSRFQAPISFTFVECDFLRCPRDTEHNVPARMQTNFMLKMFDYDWFLQHYTFYFSPKIFKTFTFIVSYRIKKTIWTFEQRKNGCTYQWSWFHVFGSINISWEIFKQALNLS